VNHALRLTGAGGLLLVWLLAAGSAAALARGAQSANYVIGPHDVLRITVWNQQDVSGEYAVERDGTFTFPLVGRVHAGGQTLRQLETDLTRRLADGIYKNPHVTASVAEYRSQQVFLVGELRQPGTYPLTGAMSLIEALAVAGSTLPAAADYALVVRSSIATGPVLPGEDASADVTRVDLRGLESGSRAENLALRDGDTVFVPRAATAFVFGQVRNPGSYPIGDTTTVLQALSLAGGVTEYGATNRIRIVRLIKGEEHELRVTLSDPVQAGDTVIVPERYF
jgi:polysaccharide export outer membrane protein